MRDKAPSEITEADLHALVEEGEVERKTLEFKRDAPDGSDLSRKEFLYDLSSLANTEGGLLLFGVAELDGRVHAIPGVTVGDPIAKATALEQAARDGIRPPIFGLESSIVSLSDGRKVIALRVPKSWNAPHQVIFQKAFRIYRRDTNAKYQPDVDELREMFSLNSTVAEKIAAFRNQRTARIAAGETPVRLEAGAKMIIHVVPFSSISTGRLLNLDWIDSHPGILAQIAGGMADCRWNIDGFIGYDDYHYTQLFRDGRIEIVKCYPEMSPSPINRPWLASSYVEGNLLNSIKSVKSVLKRLSVSPPAAMCVSLLGVSQWTIGDINGGGLSIKSHFDRDRVDIPDIVMDAFDENSQAEKTSNHKADLECSWDAQAGLVSAHMLKAARAQNL